MRRVAAALLAVPIIWAIVPSTAAFAKCVEDRCLQVGRSTKIEYDPRSERAYGFVVTDDHTFAVVTIFSKKDGEFLDAVTVGCDAKKPYFKIEKHLASGFIKVTCSADTN